MQKAVFFDRDGTINFTDGKYYVYTIADFKFNKGVVETLQYVQNKGYFLFVISNQSGIGKGIYSSNDADLVNNFMITELAKNGIIISEVYYCTHHPNSSNCLCRKPNSLLIEKLVARFSIDVQNSYFVGDALRDIEAGAKAGLKTIKIEPNSDLSVIINQIP